MPTQREREGSTRGHQFYGTMTEWLLGKSADLRTGSSGEWASDLLGRSHSSAFLAPVAKDEVNQAQGMQWTVL